MRPQAPNNIFLCGFMGVGKSTVGPLVAKALAWEFLDTDLLIEKETGMEAERPLVSAVFHNRLRLKMPLQSDPTVIYGLKEFNGNLTRKDLHDWSPYNTYRIPALPPGPSWKEHEAVRQRLSRRS